MANQTVYTSSSYKPEHSLALLVHLEILQFSESSGRSALCSKNHCKKHKILLEREGEKKHTTLAVTKYNFIKWKDDDHGAFSAKLKMMLLCFF